MPLKVPTPHPLKLKQSIVVSGHATSVSLELEFWEALRDIAVADGISVAALIRQIYVNFVPSHYQKLSSAIYVFIIKRLQEEAK